jgi:hypothetical protein
VSSLFIQLEIKPAVLCGVHLAVNHYPEMIRKILLQQEDISNGMNPE